MQESKLQRINELAAKSRREGTYGRGEKGTGGSQSGIYCRMETGSSTDAGQRLYNGRKGKQNQTEKERRNALKQCVNC